MTEKNPAIFLQNGSHPAQDLRREIHHTMSGRQGIADTGDLAVTEKSGTPDMSVDIAAGGAYVSGSSSTYQGLYFVENRGSANVAVAASDPTNDRNDMVIAQVEDDAEDSSGTDAWKLAVVTGTPAASPVDPAIPASSLVLARVVVQATATSIVDADITDLRTAGSAGAPNEQAGRAAALGGVVVCTSATRPSTDVRTGMVVYETDSGELRVYDGSNWELHSTDDDGEYQSYTPTLTNWSGTVDDSWYVRVGDFVHYVVKVTASSVSGNMFISLPVTSHRSNVTDHSTVAWARDAGANTTHSGACKFESGGGSFTFRDHTGGGIWSPGIPFTWASGDGFYINVTYRAA